MGTKYLTLQEDPAKSNPRSPLMEAAFRPKDLKQASMLLAKMAGKWAGTKFHRIKLKPYGYHTFKKSNGSGQGYMFIAPTGEKIRFGYLNKASGSGVLNQVDYWAADNGTWDSPDQSYQISSWINSVQVARDLFAYMFTGRMVNEQLNEADILQTKAGQYALHIGMPEQDVAGYGTTSGLMNKLKKHPNFDKEEYRGFEKVESQEENGAAKATKRAEKQLDERPLSDPEFIFDDIEKLTRVVATGAQNSLIIAGDPGVGKAQPTDMPVRVPGGWSQIGDLSVGDTVVAADGSHTQVTGVFPQGQKQTLRFTFEDGRSTECCTEHLWQTEHSRLGPKVRTAAEIKQRFDTMSWESFKRDRFPLISDHENVVKTVPLDPYMLGVLIGDGCMTSTLQVTTVDEEIVRHLTESIDNDYYIQQQQDGISYAIRRDESVEGRTNKYKSIMRDLELWGKQSHEKSIPEVYKECTSRQQKEALLRGLIDTDGEVTPKGSVFFHTTSEQLKDDFVYLVRSIGGLAYVKEYNLARKTANGERIAGRKSYRIRVRYRDIDQLVGLERKRENLPVGQYHNAGMRLDNIEEAGKQECVCIAIDHPDSLYITNDFIVTHNTFHVEKTLNGMLGQPGGRTGKWVQYKGARVTALGLYKIMFEHRDEMMIVFDDSDSVWKDADAINMLKSALDTSDQRQIRWGSNATRSVDKMDKDEREEIYREVDNALEEEPENVGGKIKMPNMFEFSSQVIFITNLTPDKIDSAIRSRSLFMDVHLAREDMIKRIKTVLKHKYQSIPMEEKDQVVDQLQEGQGDVTMRSVEAALAIKSSGIEDWERLVGQYV